MNVRQLAAKRLGKWVFGSSLAWGCVAPMGGVGDLFGGQSGSGGGHCSGTQVTACEGPSCSSAGVCTCIMEFSNSSSRCENLDPSLQGIDCPSGCMKPPMAGTRCKGGGVAMGPCYYPPPK